MQRSVRGFLEISEDMVHILLMLEILFTQNSKVKVFSVVFLSALNPVCSSVLKLFKMTFIMILLE